MKITEKLKSKRILLWGYGLEGKSTEKFINKYCDVSELTVFQGKREDIDEDAYDYIIKSPGIVAWDLSDKFTSMCASCGQHRFACAGLLRLHHR